MATWLGENLPTAIAWAKDHIGIVAGAIVAFLLNLVFNVWGNGDKSGVHVSEAHAPARVVTDKDIADLDTQKAADVIDDGADALKRQLDKAGDLLDGNPNKE